MFDFKWLRTLFGIFVAIGIIVGVVALILMNLKIGFMAISIIVMNGIPLLFVLDTLKFDKRFKDKDSIQ